MNDLAGVPPTTHGLTLGKFAPFHRGHQLVVETALAECDRVSVVVYDAPSTTKVPLAVRAAWVRDLYPRATVVEGWAAPEATGADPAIQSLHDHYLREELGLHDVTHFYSSEPYGSDTARGLGALDRRVDPERSKVPVSGTAIRDDPHAARDWLHPRVYRDLVSNVVLLGAPSSGKTTLAQALATELGTVWMPEYGREYWHRHQIDRRLTPDQLVDLAEGHLEREERLLLEARGLLITDTSALTTWRYGMNYHGWVHPRLDQLADDSARRYDVVVLCEPDFPHDDTWDRSGDGERQRMHRQIESDLTVRRIPFLRARGPVDQRVGQLSQRLRRLTPFTPFADLVGVRQ